MGRSSGSSSRYTNVKTTKSPVVSKPAAAPVVNNGGGGSFLSGMLGNVMAGVGLGAGSEIGHRVVGSMMDGKKEDKEVCDRRRLDGCLKEGGDCVEEMREFMRCLEGK